MALWAKGTLTGLGVLVAALALAVWVGSRAQQRAMSQLVESLRASSSAGAARVSFKDFNRLPAPVARYFRRVLREDQQIIRWARFRQLGTLRTDVHSDRWLPFESDQVVAPSATGFVWNARVDIGPLLHVRVRDALIGGQGSGQVSLISAFTVAARGGNLEMTRGPCIVVWLRPCGTRLHFFRAPSCDGAP
jgi:hypothetical protein